MTKARDLSNIISGGFTESDIPNLSTSKITSGTFADARISSGSVTQHVTATDLQPVKSDISALALREATNESSAAFNLPNQFIDTFATDTLGTKTNVQVDSGYVSSITGGALTGSFTNMSSSNFSAQGNWTISGNNITMDTSPDNDTGSHTGQGSSAITFGANKPFQFKAGPTYNNTGYGPYFGFRKTSTSTAVQAVGANLDDQGEFYYRHGSNAGNPGIYANDGAGDGNESRVYTDSSDSGRYVGIERTVAGIFKLHSSSSNNIAFDNSNSTLRYTFTNAYTGAYYFIISGQGSHRSDLDNLAYDLGTAQTVSATGTAIQNTNTVGSAKTKVGGTILYKDNSGTATLGTDLKIYFTCNGGTNWTEASSYSAITPVYSTGIKQVRLGETTCTSGTDIRYKAVWANQASGSKETQLHGVGIIY